MKILSFADLHLDSAFTGFAENERAIRRELLNRVFCRICELCIEEKADAVFIGGDLFDVPEPSEAVEELVKYELAALPCRVYISPGNHDYYISGGVFDRMPENVFVFCDTCLSTVYNSELFLAVDGYAFTSENYTDDPLLSFSSVKNEGYVHVLLAHTDLSQSSGVYAPFLLSRLEGTDYSFAFLGHVHTNTASMQSGTCLAAYSGIPQGRSIDEPINGGARIVEIIDGEVLQNRLVDVSVWTNRILETDTDSIASDAELVSRLISELKHMELGRYDIVRCILVGEHDFFYTPNVDFIQSRLTHEFEDMIFSVKNKATPKQDRDSLMSDPSIIGVLYRTLFEDGDLSEEYDHDTRLRAFRLAVSAIKGDNVNPEMI